jgi:acetolactate synthase I/II/III large subunit
MIKLSDYIMQVIADLGVRHVFMLPGGGAMHLVDSLGRNKRLSYICNLHEQACAIAADAYGQYTNNIGVALVTTGPGGTNTITGVAAAWLDSTPVLFLSGQVKRSDMIGDRGVRQVGFQEIDIVSLVRPITKYAVTVMDPSSIRYHLEKALHLATHGRPGPVWIDVPLDVQAAVIDESTLRGYEDFLNPPTADPGKLREAAARALRLLAQARRPVILAGNGIRLAKGVDAFHSLIERLGVPVLTTWKAADLIPDDHPLYAGRPGAVGQRGANFAQQTADWMLIIGARLDLGQTAYRHENFAPGAVKIMVDVDPAEIQKMQMRIEVPVTADAGEFIRELGRQVEPGTPVDRSRWLDRCRRWRSEYPVVLPEYWAEIGHVNDYVLIDVLSDELTAADLLIPGSSGACSERTMQAIRVKAGLRVFNSEGLGPMGFGIPAAIGACIASGGRRTVCIDGDGGFAMNLQELEVVRRLALPIKFFVLNNGGYGSIQATQRTYFNGHFVASTRSSGLTLPDVAGVATAFGIPPTRLADHANLRERVRDILATGGPTICEVRVSADQPTAPRVASRQNEDGSMESAPMEDLWPFLDRQDLRRNMAHEY